MAGYPTADGHPNLSGNYIPTLFSTLVLVEFYKATVFGAISNTDYEGELQKFGDTLRIRELPEIVSRAYVKGQKLQYDNPDPSYIDLVINKGFYWAIAINELDKMQSDLDYAQKWAVHASKKQKIQIDGEMLSQVYGDVDSNNTGATAGKISSNIDLGSSGSPLALTSANIVDKIVESGVVLDEQDVPDEDRYYVLPAWACGLLKSSDLKDASLTGDGKSTLRNGRVGMIDRFEIYMSNNITKTTDGSYSVDNAIFGQKHAIAFASQMTSTETVDNQDDFGKLMRSLQAYGYKTTKPEALGHLYARKG